MARRGRPTEFDEALVKETFTLPESLSQRLDEAAKTRKGGRPGVPGRKRTKVQIVRDALERELSEESTPPAPVTADDIMRVVREALRAEHQDAICIHLEEEALAEFKRLSNAVGYAEPQQFVDALARRAMAVGENTVDQFLREPRRQAVAA